MNFFDFISTVLFTFICISNDKVITQPCVVISQLLWQCGKGKGPIRCFLKAATLGGSKQSLVKILKGAAASGPYAFKIEIKHCPVSLQVQGVLQGARCMYGNEQVCCTWLHAIMKLAWV